MFFHIKYHSLLSFDSPISEQQVELRLIPRCDEHQKLISSSFHLQSEVSLLAHHDAFGNEVRSFNLIPAHSKLEIFFEAEVENDLENPFNTFMLNPNEERNAIAQLLKEQPRNWDFILPFEAHIPDLTLYLTSTSWPTYDPEKNILYSIQKAMDWMKKEFRYESGATLVHGSLEDFLKKRSGVCQDFAHLLIALVRHWGFPARYVMGYQYLQDSNALPATHAWTEVYVPGSGWQGFDPTHALLANHHLIPVAVGRNSRDAAPERGSFKGDAGSSSPQLDLIVSQQ